MALSSMTGYGRGDAVREGIGATVELSSVNRKQLEIKISLPRSLTVLESRVAERVQERLSRGFVSGTVTVRSTPAARRRALRVDDELAGATVRKLRAAASRLGLRDDLGAALLLSLPDVVHWGAAEEDSEAAWPAVAKALDGALAALAAMRRREGRALEADLRARCGRLRGFVERIRDEAPHVAPRYRRQLLARLSAAGLEVEARDPQVLKEIVLFAERSDISEEITRLDSHLRQGDGLLRTRAPVGRTLDFLAQEMFREINTIGSKANDVRITRQVIQFKTELERIREQVQNVE